VDFNELTWELEPTSEEVLDYTFTVLRSEAPAGPFETLTPAFEDRYLFVDNQIKIGHNYRSYYYKIRITHKASGDTKDFGPVTVEPEADLIAIELRKHVALLMREFAGRRCWILPVRTTGARCGCWDEALQKTTRSGCPTCYDTGYVRGYMHPIESWVQIDPVAKDEQVTGVGKLQQQNTTARMPFFPPVKPDDLLIEAENIRWRIGTVNQTEQGRARVHQELTLHRIPSTDTEYRIPLILDQALKDLFVNPSRNFTNPQTLAAFEEEEFPAILGIYTTNPSR
jgi:hypothetical protein